MDNMFRVPVQWIPDPVNWRSYVLRLARAGFHPLLPQQRLGRGGHHRRQPAAGSLAGYSLAKFRYFGRGLLFILILSTMMLPLEVTMVPLFLIIKQLDWANSYQGLIVPFLVDGFGVFLMRQYMLGIPKDLIELGPHRRRLGTAHLLADRHAAVQAGPGRARRVHLPRSLGHVHLAADHHHQGFAAHPAARRSRCS